MNDAMEKGRAAFKEEACEHLIELENALLKLEETPDDANLIGAAFRALHTIKGSGAMFGFEETSRFTHEVETVFALVREGLIQITPSLLKATLQAHDHIQMLLERDNSGSHTDFDTTPLLNTLRGFMPAAKAAAAPVAATVNVSPSDPEKQNLFRVRFQPHADIFASGTNPLLLLREISSLGQATVIANTERIPPLAQLETERCYTSWDIILTTIQDIEAIRDVFIFVEDRCELKIEFIGDSNNLEPDQRRIGDILLARGDVDNRELQKLLHGQKHLGELLVDAGLATSNTIQAALAEQHQVKDLREKKEKSEVVSSLRVPADKLDKLVNLVGELVTTQARLTQFTLTHNESAELVMITEAIERLTAELRDNTMSMRMLPIGSTFSSFKRLVHDLSNELGKIIVLKTEGAETELDKTVIDRLHDPLVHIIRNSIDHGIELPEIRQALGKSPEGVIFLSALYSGTNVLVSIKDDGAGLDSETIRAKAREKGLIAPDAQLSNKEILDLIFLPGFSTAAQVSNVSGRGVGLDVVKRSIEALRGEVEIQSTPAQGTTLTLKIPLTLAIIDGLLVSIAGEYFVIPAAIVRECVELSRADVARAHERQIANVRGEIVPYIRLREQFLITGQTPALEQIVITELDGQRIGWVVDHVIGEHQTVIKSLGRIYKHLDFFSGATILGNGTVAIILDIRKLWQFVIRNS